MFVFVVVIVALYFANVVSKQCFQIIYLLESWDPKPTVFDNLHENLMPLTSLFLL